MDTKKTAEERALERHRIISPVLTAMDENSDKAKIRMLKEQAGQKAGVSRKTVTRWVEFYEQKGLDGLKYREVPSNRKRLIPEELLKEAILLRLEVPKRSVGTIIEILEMEGKVMPGLLKRTTLTDMLRESGYSQSQMKLYETPGVAARRFERRERNDLWQADIKYSPYMRMDGKMAQVYYVGLIDDATRYLVHGEFYGGLDAGIVEDALRKAVHKEGAPKRLYMDNGSQFRTKWMERGCAVMGIKMIYAAPYSPESKGKIERFNRTLESFLEEAGLKNPGSLGELNELYKIWEEECYNKREHSALGMTPEQAYDSSKAPKRYLSAETIAEAFLRVEQRKVDKSGCISFGGKKYEVGVVYIGRKIDIVYDAGDTSVITVDDKHFNKRFQITEQLIGPHTGPRPKLPNFMTGEKPETSRLLDGKAKRYEAHRKLEAQHVISYAAINRSEGGGGNV
jgi:transposase InsO family protein